MGSCHSAYRIMLGAHKPHETVHLQDENVLASHHKRLRIFALETECTMSAASLMANEQELAMWDWCERPSRRPETDLGVDAVSLVGVGWELRGGQSRPR